MTAIYIFLILVGVFLVYAWMLYNGLVTQKMRVNEAWSQIDVQLKRRADLIPNLVETVKGYAKHEKEVFFEVTKARSALLSAQTPPEKAEANNQLSQTMKSLFAVAENYPQLRATENFKTFQEEYTDTEDKVAYSRQFYNNVVMDYNTTLRVFPSVFFAQAFGFKPAEFFGTDLTPEDRQAVKVKFS